MKFTDTQIKALKKTLGGIKKVDPTAPTWIDLRDYVLELPEPIQRQLIRENVPWIRTILKVQLEPVDDARFDVLRGKRLIGLVSGSDDAWTACLRKPAGDGSHFYSIIGETAERAEAVRIVSDADAKEN